MNLITTVTLFLILSPALVAGNYVIGGTNYILPDKYDIDTSYYYQLTFVDGSSAETDPLSYNIGQQKLEMALSNAVTAQYWRFTQDG